MATFITAVLAIAFSRLLLQAAARVVFFLVGVILAAILKIILFPFKLVFRLLVGAPRIKKNIRATVSNFRIIDGDTIAVGGQRYRLVGIDAPEMGQGEAGLMSKKHLMDMTRNSQIQIAPRGFDCYNRVLCDLWTLPRDGSKEVHINHQMVKDGFAFIGRDRAFWKRDEKRARRQKKGIWARRMRVQRPDAFRRAAA
jgi:endonuclease YncB( thermonuclease family)